jgi:hypothetical protein
MKRELIAGLILVVIITFIPIGNDVNVNVGVTVKHPVKEQTKATMEQKKANKIMAMRFAKAGYDWDLRQRKCIYRLFTAESRFDHLAKNQQGSSAYGIAQVLREKSNDPAIQILNGYKYIKHRYQTPCNAWSHHVRRNWY